MTNNYVVYRLVCIPTGKSYIGRSKNIQNRLRSHFSSKEKNPCSALAKDIVEFGKKSFIYVVLDKDLDESASKEAEARYIQAYGTVHPFGYNLQTGDINRNHHPGRRKKAGGYTWVYANA